MTTEIAADMPTPIVLDSVLDEELEPIARRIELLQTTAILQIAREAAKIHEVLRYRRSEGGYTGYMEKRLGYSSSSAYRLLDVNTVLGTSESFPNWETLPVSAVYQLCERSTPKEARDEVTGRLAVGQKLSCATVAEVIAKAKGKTTTAASPPPVTNSAESPEAFHAVVLQAIGGRRRSIPAGGGANSAANPQAGDQVAPGEHDGRDADDDIGQGERATDALDINHPDHAGESDEPAGDHKSTADTAPAPAATAKAKAKASAPKATAHAARNPKRSLLETWEATALKDRQPLRDQIVADYFAEASVSNIFDKLSGAQRLEAYDLAVRGYAAAETPIKPTKTDKKLLENLGGTLRWGSRPGRSGIRCTGTEDHQGKVGCE